MRLTKNSSYAVRPVNYIFRPGSKKQTNKSMIGLSTWDILAFIGFIFLIIFFYAGRNFVWTAFSIGVIAAVIICGIYFFKDDEWPWKLFKKIIIVTTYAGIVFELIGRIIDMAKKK